MSPLLEHLPLALFFITYFLYGFFPATQIFIIATSIILFAQFFSDPKQPFKNYLSSLLIIALGSLSILTNNPLYLIWAPTIKYLLAALVLLTSQYIFDQSLLEKGFQLASLHAPNYNWQRLDLFLSLCFITMAVLNIQVFKLYGTDTWAKFKIYSLFIWALLFIPIVLHIESKSHDSQPS